MKCKLLLPFIVFTLMLIVPFCEDKVIGFVIKS